MSEHGRPYWRRALVVVVWICAACRLDLSGDESRCGHTQRSSRNYVTACSKPDARGPAPAGAVASDAQRARRFRVLASEPAGGEIIQDPSAPILVTFSEPLDPATVTTATVEVRRAGARVSVDPVLDASDATRLRLIPREPWSLATQYTVHLTDSIASHSGALLAEVTMRLQTRQGRWIAGPIATGEEHERYARARLVRSPSGEPLAAWDVSERDARGESSRVSRRTTDGAWVAVEQANGPGGAPAIGILYDGTLLFGHAKGAPSGESWQLQCLDSKHGLRAVPGAGDYGFFALEDVHTDATWLITLVQRKFVPFGSTPSSFTILETGCRAPQATLRRELSASEGSKIASVRILDRHNFVWLERRADAAASDAGASLWGLRMADPDCAEANGCVTRLSDPDAAADSPVTASAEGERSLVAVAWRQSRDGRSAVWSRLGPHYGSWAEGRPISHEDGTVRAPALALSRSRALSAWIQAQHGRTRIAAASYADGVWSAPFAVSGIFDDRPDIAPSVAVDASGQGIVAWAQPSASEPAKFEIHARAVSPGSGPELAGRDTVISIQHDAASEVAVVMGDYGQAYALWVEGASLWFGRYE